MYCSALIFRLWGVLETNQQPWRKGLWNEAANIGSGVEQKTNSAIWGSLGTSFSLHRRFVRVLFVVRFRLMFAVCLPCVLQGSTEVLGSGCVGRLGIKVQSRPAAPFRSAANWCAVLCRRPLFNLREFEQWFVWIRYPCIRFSFIIIICMIILKWDEFLPQRCQSISKFFYQQSRNVSAQSKILFCP